MAHRRPRRAFVMAGAAALLSTSLLSGCGYGLATDRPYTQAWGANDNSSDVYVQGAMVVATEDGKGTFIATLTNPTADPISLTELTGAGSNLSADLSKPIEVPARGAVNLGDDHGVPVTGDFVLTESPYLEVTLSFEGAQAVTMEIPVVPAEGDFEDFAHSTGDADKSTDAPSEESSPSEEPSESSHSH